MKPRNQSPQRSHPRRRRLWLALIPTLASGLTGALPIGDLCTSVPLRPLALTSAIDGIGGGLSDRWFGWGSSARADEPAASGREGAPRAASSPDSPDAQNRSQSLADRLDANRDGFITGDEIEEERKPLFERLLRQGDKDRDGKLSKAELVEALREQPRGNPPPGAGPDGRPAPPGVPAGPGEPPRVAPAEVLQRFDRNGDGKLSREEAPERMRDNFERVDRNGDGQVDLEELRGAFAALARGVGPGGEPGRPNPQGRPGEPGRPDGNGQRANPEMIGRMFDQLDKNNDGKLTIDEVPEERRAMIGRALERVEGVNRDGLTKEQFVKGLMALAANAPRPDRAPGDRRPEGTPAPRREGDAPRREGDAPRREGDAPRREGDAPRREGDAPRREGDAPRREGDAPPRPMLAIFSALDANGDGEISADELANAQKALAKFDRNGDGKISREELAGPPPRGR